LAIARTFGQSLGAALVAIAQALVAGIKLIARGFARNRKFAIGRDNFCVLLSHFNRFGLASDLLGTYLNEDLHGKTAAHLQPRQGYRRRIECMKYRGP